MEKIKTIYQCTLSCEHGDTSESQAAHSSWLALTGPDPPSSVPLDWKEAIHWLQDVFLPGGFFSLPRPLYEEVKNGSVIIDRSVMPLDGILEASHQDHVLDSATIPDLIVFQSVNPNQRKRQYIRILHEEAEFQYTFVVSRVRVLSFDMNPCKLFCDVRECEQDSLDFRSFIRNIRSLCKSCYKWQEKKLLPGLRLSTTAKEVPKPLVDLDHYDIPIDLSSEGVEAGHEVAVLQATEQIGVFPKRLSNAATMALTAIMTRQRQTAGDAVSLKGVSSEALSLLEQAGHIRTSSRSESSFLGQVVVDRASWTALACLICPEQLICWSSGLDIRKMSKVELVLALIRGGWAYDGFVEASWCPGQPKRFQALLSRPRSYFMALLDCDRIVANGVESIQQGECDGYYRCLFSLQGDKLGAILNVCPEEPRSNAWYLDKLKFDDVVPEPIADRPADEVMAAGSRAPLMLTNVLPSDVAGDFWQRAIVNDGRHPELRVYFDKGTAQNGKPRAFAACSRHACRRYRHCDDYADQMECLAEYLAWHNASLHISTKESHMSYVPTPSEVAEVREMMTITCF